jgi:hypothetical protein
MAKLTVLQQNSLITNDIVDLHRLENQRQCGLQVVFANGSRKAPLQVDGSRFKRNAVLHGE